MMELAVQRRRERRKFAWGISLAVVAAGLAIGLAIAVGPTAIDWSKVWSDPTSLDAKKVFGLRLPRALAAQIAGGALALAGLVFQTLLRNPLASPYGLGVSSGGSLGAALALGVGLHFVPAAAFLGCLGAVALVYAVAWRRGGVRATTLLLSGVVVGSFLSALLLLVNLTLRHEQRERLFRWLIGGLPDIQEPFLLATAGSGLVLGGLCTFAIARGLNVLIVGEEAAQRLGVGVARLRTAGFLLGSLLTGSAVALAGPLGGVGLIIPHMFRWWFGHDHRFLVPACGIGGGTFLVLVDVCAQHIWSVPVPAGVVTAFLGGPFFILLLRREAKHFHD